MKNKILHELISPVSLEEFYTSFYEKKCLYVKDRPSDFYNNILTTKDIDATLALNILPIGAIRMAALQPIPHNNWTQFYGGKNIKVDYSKIKEQLNKGNSLVLNGFHKYVPKLRQFIDALEVENLFEAWTNIYITPPGNQAFKKHYDTHDVFILQIKGSKHWKLYNSPITLPDRSQNFFDIYDDESKFDLEQEITLKEGELIYIPRGYVHQATTTNDTSVHITLGITPLRVIDLWNTFYNESVSDDFFRNSLIYAQSNGEGKEQFLKQKFIEIIQNSPLEELVSNTKKTWIEHHLKVPQKNILSNLIAKDNIHEDSLIAVRKDLTISTYIEEPFYVVASNNQKEKFPFFLEKTLASILKADKPISVKEIVGTFSIHEKLKLARRLLEASFIEIIVD